MSNMMASNDDEQDSRMWDEQDEFTWVGLSPHNDFGEYLCGLEFLPNPTGFDSNVFESFFASLPEESPVEVSNVSEPISNEIEDDPADIPIDRKEWRLKDEKTQRLRQPRLYEFFLLLLNKEHYRSYASYVDQKSGTFVVHQPKKVAELWQEVKNRQSNGKMTYDKLARAVRDYYKDDIMQKTNTRFTFRFSETTLRKSILDENNNIYVENQSESQ